jgi:hypothetical protein
MDDSSYESLRRWSGHGDNAEPDPELSDWIRDWNQKYEWPRFSIATTSTAFSAFEKRYGNQLPQYRGDLTPYWEDGAGSSALETRMSRNAADRINQAEALRAVTNKADYEVAELRGMARLLLYPNTLGAHGTASLIQRIPSSKQWDVKLRGDAERLPPIEKSVGLKARPHVGGRLRYSTALPGFAAKLFMFLSSYRKREITSVVTMADRCRPRGLHPES